MRLWMLALVVLALSFLLYLLTKPSAGCINGTLEDVDVSQRVLVIDGKTFEVRGLFYEGNNAYNAWDLSYILETHIGESIHVCYDEEGKVELIEVNGRSFGRYGH